MRVRLGHVDVVDRVVDAAGRAQAEHVPIVDEGRLADGQHEDARLARVSDDAEGVNVRRVLDAGGEAPRAAQPEPAAIPHRRARPRALPGDDRQAVAAEQLLHGFVLQVGATGADGERRRHHHPARRRIAVAHVLEHFQRRNRIEFSAAAQHLRRPHAEQAFAMQRVDDRRRQLSIAIASVRVLVGDRTHELRARRQIG